MGGWKSRGTGQSHVGPWGIGWVRGWQSCVDLDSYPGSD